MFLNHSTFIVITLKNSRVKLTIWPQLHINIYLYAMLKSDCFSNSVQIVCTVRVPEILCIQTNVSFTWIYCQSALCHHCQSSALGHLGVTLCQRFWNYSARYSVYSMIWGLHFWGHELFTVILRLRNRIKKLESEKAGLI